MAVDIYQNKEQFKNGVRINEFILDNNKWFNRTSSGGYSTNIKGNPSRLGADVLCNCTGFACGAFNETYYKCSVLSDKQPSTFFKYNMRNNAKYFLDGIRIQHYRLKYPKSQYPEKYASGSMGNYCFSEEAGEEIARTLNYPDVFRNPDAAYPNLHYPYTSYSDASCGICNWGDSSVADLYDYIVPPSGRPPEGGLVVWGGGKCNHVAYIAEVKDDDNIIILQAGYNTSSWSLRNIANTGWVCDKRLSSRGKNNIWKYQVSMPSKAVCLGFIANPLVSEVPPSVSDSFVIINGKRHIPHICINSTWIRHNAYILQEGKWKR